MDKTKKTNAMRLLDQKGIAYEPLSYKVEGDNYDGLSVSKQIGLPASQVYKTLVLHQDREYFVAMIPVDRVLDLKKLAVAAGAKKLELIPVAEITKVTGYVRGGCSPLAMKKLYPTFIDRSALSREKIAVSAGIRGGQIYLSPQELVALLGITAADLVSEEAHD